jgi:alanyl-tRNA synthetase
VGYDELEGVEAKVLQITSAENAAFIIVDRTPFYSEMGGDSGTLFFRVTNDCHMRYAAQGPGNIFT